MKRTLQNNTLTNDQKEVLIGLLLGDACIHFRNKSKKAVRVEFKVGKNNYQYLLHLKKIYENFFHKTTPIGESKKAFYIKTKTIKLFYPFYLLFYNNKKKILSKDLVCSPWFTNKSLAYWFMDDGHCENKAGRYKISTQCFSVEEQQLLQMCLKNKFNLETALYKKEGSNILVIKRHSTNCFRTLIEPFIIESLSYKLGTFRRDNSGVLLKKQNNINA